MSDPQDELRKALREIGQEVGRTMEQAGRLFRQTAQQMGFEDVSEKLKGFSPKGFSPFGTGMGGSRPQPATSPIEAIRQLGELRDAGLLTEAEFAVKKAELLERI